MKSLRRARVTACRKAGRPGLLPHDLRRSAVRNLERAGISRSVAITEAVELARTLSTDDSPRFLNGVLSRIADLAVYLRTTR